MKFHRLIAAFFLGLMVLSHTSCGLPMALGRSVQRFAAPRSVEATPEGRAALTDALRNLQAEEESAD